jgi:hypothetical protein
VNDVFCREVNVMAQLVCNSAMYKGQFYPITDYEGTEEERYSSTLSLTSVLDGGAWLTPRLGCVTPGKESCYFKPVLQQ